MKLWIKQINLRYTMAKILDIHHKINFERFLLEKVFSSDIYKFELFIDNLIKSGGIISGGTLVKIIASPFEKWYGQDLDIYVNTYKAANFANKIKSENHNTYEQFTVYTPNIKNGYYCKSFLQKNGINHVFKLHPRIINFKHLGMPMDIVSVRNDKDVVDVVKNFDLSFCKVYYDGHNVYAFHPAHLVCKSGELSEDYLESYKEKNMFILDRVEKYKTRGFKIKIPSSAKNALKIEQCINPIYHNFFLQILTEIQSNCYELDDILSHAIREHYDDPSFIVSFAKSKGHKNIIIPLFQIYDNCNSYYMCDKEYIETLKKSIVDYAKKELYEIIKSEYSTIDEILKNYMNLGVLQKENKLQSKSTFKRNIAAIQQINPFTNQSAEQISRFDQIYNEYLVKSYNDKNKEIIEFVELVLSTK